jgi:hypothetical protein
VCGACFKVGANGSIEAPREGVRCGAESCFVAWVKEIGGAAILASRGVSGDTSGPAAGQAAQSPTPLWRSPAQQSHC